MLRKIITVIMLNTLLIGLLGCSEKKSATHQVKNEEKIVIYSARKEHLIKPVFDFYTKKTGVKIQYITDKAGPLLVRIQSEGASTPADILLTTDIGFLWRAQEMNLLQGVDSQVIMDNVPAYLRDKKHRWFAITQRSRVIVYASDRVKPDELSTYEDLASNKFKDKLCLRTSKKSYNQSLIASILAHDGEEKTQQVVDGWVKNLAVAPFSNDTSAMKAVMAGQCDVTLVNTYYYGRLEKDKAQGSLKIFWPNQNTTGVHMNISGAGLLKHAKQPEAATTFLEWLSSEEAQTLLVKMNLEFPVNPRVKPVSQVLSWGSFKPDGLPMNVIANYQQEAVKIIDRAGYR